MTRIFVLSPAHCGGARARLVLNERAAFDLARRVRARPGAPLGEVFSFMSGLYFRGKLSYAQAFARPLDGRVGVYVITPTEGLRPPDEPVDLERLRSFSRVDIDSDDPRYRAPLDRDARQLAGRIGPEGEVILLGSIATGKYVGPLLSALGERLRFPVDFVGRGDMSRGGLLLRCVRAGTELTYVSVRDAVRRGPRPPRLVKDATTGLPLLLLPAGFEYLTFGWTGDLLKDGTTLTPASHDGMAAFQARHGRVRLVRNHEIGSSAGAFAPALAYDLAAGGGTTTLEFDTKHGQFIEAWPSIAGTVTNCAGGPTPWGSWLTCEENVSQPAPTNGLTKPHGYIYEVPAFGETTHEPIKAMGRFVHEANATDPHTGLVYETEDAGFTSGFYRYVPSQRGKLAAGGVLQMLAIEGKPAYNTRLGQIQDEPLDVVWVTIDVPDPAVPAAPTSVFAQGTAKGGAAFARLEGAWYGRGKIFFTSTNGGNAGQGQVWEYEPSSETLRLVFESPAAEVLNSPDNITVSPRGGLVLCEDGSGSEFLHGLTVDGEIFRFAQSNVVLNGERNAIVGDFRGAEFAGATYSPDGKWLFFNIQSPGITFAVTGPWRNGAL